jgi:hypothetical protein
VRRVLFCSVLLSLGLAALRFEQHFIAKERHVLIKSEQQFQAAFVWAGIETDRRAVHIFQ